jgi:anti-sigma factor RsiW
MASMKKDDKKLIHKAIDGEASQSETKRLREKLEADGRIRSEFEQLKRVMKDTTRIRVDVPPDFKDKVLNETSRRIKPKP